MDGRGGWSALAGDYDNDSEYVTVSIDGVDNINFGVDGNNCFAQKEITIPEAFLLDLFNEQIPLVVTIISSVDVEMGGCGNTNSHQVELIYPSDNQIYLHNGQKEDAARLQGYIVALSK